MKQILQSLKTGATEVADIPCPKPKFGEILIRTTATLISSGTERMLVEFGKANLIDKARQQPDKVRMVLDKVKTDGLIPTLNAVMNKLDQPLPLGYCNVGVVIEVGSGVTDFRVGDRVASNGKHAEMVSVPVNLCAKIPDAVTDDAATFTVIGAIGLQGVRLAEPTLGEAFVVTGLGLIGLMTVQLLRAHGCRVLGIDFDPNKLELARQFGAETVDLSRGEDPVAVAMAFSRGRGVDGVLITAATSSNEPVHQAALMCRKRGRIVLVGVAGLELSRADFYEKELTFQVSCSYGPGRYDQNYEDKGQDYPIGFVRWTEQRNFEALLDMMADGRLSVRDLVSHRFPIAEAQAAYTLIANDAVPSLGVLLQYPAREAKSDAELKRSVVMLSAPGRETSAGAKVGFLGAGNYGTQVLIPAFRKTGAQLKTIVSSGGVSGFHAGRKYGFVQTSTDAESVLGDPEVNAVVISTRHDSHARYVCSALEAGKHVFVEKPLALSLAEVERVEESYRLASERYERTPLLMVGFNRRFSPQVLKMQHLLRSVREPKSFIMTVNAGAIPSDHWTQDIMVGGGRIIGEGCHFIDLLRCLAECPIVSYQVTAMGSHDAVDVRDDKASIILNFADGSFGTIHYLANGHKAYPKERLEVFTGGRILQLDNFRKLRGFGWPGFSKFNLWRQDKGNEACAVAFVDAVMQGSSSPIPFDEVIEVAKITIEIGEAARL